MTIRPMTLDDYDPVLSLWFDTPGMGLSDKEDSREGIARYLARNPTTCFVAEMDGRIVGVVLAGHDGRRGMLHHMAVAGREQRKGIGKALLEAATAALMREGIHKVALVVFRKNEKGNAFWEKHGFTAREDLVYRNRAILESKRMVPPERRDAE